MLAVERPEMQQCSTSEVEQTWAFIDHRPGDGVLFSFKFSLLSPRRGITQRQKNQHNLILRCSRITQVVLNIRMLRRSSLSIFFVESVIVRIGYRTLVCSTDLYLPLLCVLISILLASDRTLKTYREWHSDSLGVERVVKGCRSERSEERMQT